MEQEQIYDEVEKIVSLLESDKQPITVYHCWMILTKGVSK